MDSHRALWAAVVLQARDDVAVEPVDSVFYNQAVGFFRDPGEWRLSREAIADFLAIHVDDIERLGRLTIAARRAADGLPEQAPVESKPPAAPKVAPKSTPPAVPAPWPRLVAVPAPTPANDNKRPGGRRMKLNYNPFDPLAKLLRDIQQEADVPLIGVKLRT
jgi:hypothetical protein